MALNAIITVLDYYSISFMSYTVDEACHFCTPSIAKRNWKIVRFNCTALHVSHAIHCIRPQKENPFLVFQVSAANPATILLITYLAPYWHQKHFSCISQSPFHSMKCIYPTICNIYPVCTQKTNWKHYQRGL